jgi:hypothetical protein
MKMVRMVKQVLWMGAYLWAAREWIKGIKEGDYDWCTLYTYMKIAQWNVEIFLRRGEGRQGRMVKAENVVKIHCKHICKCDNNLPLQLIHAYKHVKRKIHLMIPMLQRKTISGTVGYWFRNQTQSCQLHVKRNSTLSCNLTAELLKRHINHKKQHMTHASYDTEHWRVRMNWVWRAGHLS